MEEELSCHKSHQRKGISLRASGKPLTSELYPNNLSGRHFCIVKTDIITFFRDQRGQFQVNLPLYRSAAFIIVGDQKLYAFQSLLETQHRKEYIHKDSFTIESPFIEK